MKHESHSLKGFFIGLGLGLVCGLVLGCWLCGRDQTITTNTITKIDTVKYYKPVPIPKRELSRKTLRLPIMIFAPADTVVKTIIVRETDSVKVEFPVERREYRDSTYYAIVSGVVVGDRGPTLDYIETYNKTITNSVVVKPKAVRPYIGASVGVFGTWSVGVGGGVLINDRHALGVEYMRTSQNNSIQLKYNYLFLKPEYHENNRK